jgi:hypothetical protein
VPIASVDLECAVLAQGAGGANHYSTGYSRNGRR